jgi:hypothetical protein
MKKIIQSLAVAAVVGGAVATSDAATILVSNAVERSTFWTSNNVYELLDIIFVRSNATLTVEQGTTILGWKDADTTLTNATGSAVNNPGSLICTRGSKIRLLGTEAHPIIGDAKSFDGSKESRWGGIAVCGGAYTAFGTATGANPNKTDVQLEGVVALGDNGKYGGGNDDDDSGVIRYVSIRNAGFGLAANNELNGLGLAGVGRETAVDHVEVYNNQDDGFEFWGGTVNAKYLVAWNVGDDSVDIDEGYRGKLQFIFGVQGDTLASAATIGGGIADRGMELDGGNSPDASLPYALWKMYNTTIVGKGQNGGPGGSGTYSQYTNNVAFFMRDNAGGQIRNSVFVDFGGSVLHMEAEGFNGANNPTNVQQRFLTDWSDLPTGAISNSPPNSYLYKTQTDGYQAEITHNVFYQFGRFLQDTAIDDLKANAKTDNSTAGSQTADSTNVFLLASGANNVVDLTSTGGAPIVSWTRTNDAAVGRMLNVVAINPLAANAATSSPITAPTDGFYTPVNYRGAFSTTNIWVANWTYVWQQGLIANVTPPAAPDISIVVTNTQPEIYIPTVNGITYALEASYDNKHWRPLTLINGDGTTQVYVDSTGLTNNVHYRVVVP